MLKILIFQICLNLIFNISIGNIPLNELKFPKTYFLKKIYMDLIFEKLKGFKMLKRKR
jgi:hypothetical protein